MVMNFKDILFILMVFGARAMVGFDEVCPLMTCMSFSLASVLLLLVATLL